MTDDESDDDWRIESHNQLLDACAIRTYELRHGIADKSARLQMMNPAPPSLVTEIAWWAWTALAAFEFYVLAETENGRRSLILCPLWAASVVGVLTVHSTNGPGRGFWSRTPWAINFGGLAIFGWLVATAGILPIANDHEIAPR